MNYHIQAFALLYRIFVLCFQLVKRNHLQREQHNIISKKIKNLIYRASDQFINLHNFLNHDLFRLCTKRLTNLSIYEFEANQ